MLFGLFGFCTAQNGVQLFFPASVFASALNNTCSLLLQLVRFNILLNQRIINTTKWCSGDNAIIAFSHIPAMDSLLTFK